MAMELAPADWLERPIAIELLADALALYPKARELMPSALEPAPTAMD